MSWIPPFAFLGLGAALCTWKRHLVSAEMIKILYHPFLYVTLGVMTLAIPLWAEASLRFGDFRIGGFRALPSLLVFALAAGFGIKLASFATVIFSALSFAGEFDRGTIKPILTLPVTRTDLFLAKLGSLMLLAGALALVALSESLFWGLARGEMGHVWREEIHDVFPRHEVLLEHARMAVCMIWLPLLATCCLGILISNCTDSGGHAVAAALVFYILLDLAPSILPQQWWSPQSGYNVFTFYPSYAFGTLTEFARGSSSARWGEVVQSYGMQTIVPAISAALLLLPSYARFVRRNVLA